MGMDRKPFQEYLGEIQKGLVRGNYTELSYYPALKELLEALEPGLVATSNPQRIACGAPDFVLSRGASTVGYVEAKDVGKSLDEAEKSEQLNRYRDSLPNLILTDYLEFRWYVDGVRRATARLGTIDKNGKVSQDKGGIEAVKDLIATFLAHRGEAVGTPKEMAVRMARLAHMIQDLIVAAFEKEPDSGTLHAQFTAFKDNLIPDLSAKQFADMYAQTIAYGLFAARCTNPGGTGFTRQNAAYLLPRTNPFLRKLFNHIAGPELDDRIAWLVDDLAQVLAQADMAAILQDFGKRAAKEDPVVHFYETFLAAYDPKVREMRGVYYTPEPVVSYIVRSIDHLLKTRFGKPQGLADEKTRILDPAVGTATFLYMVINEIHQAMVSQGQKGMWNDYVTDKLLPRIFGFELLMAPYAVAHLKLGLLLQETGYQFKSDQRLGIYLTNTLEEAIKHSEVMFAEWITEEANAAAQIKKEKPIMVVLGNPPYSGHSANVSKKIVTDSKTGKTKEELTWIGNLIEDYKTVDGKSLGEKNPKWLQDDYVKFIRFGQWRIKETEKGILGFITNHSYLDNPTFRGMRQSIMDTFTDIYILNLHGNAKKKEVAPDGGKDENVFDIQQGVAIGILVKEPGKTSPAAVHYADLWGLRDGKYHALVETDITETGWAELNPGSPFYLFVPRDEAHLEEYEKGWKITDVFPVNSVGIVTARDELTIHWTGREVEDTVKDFVSLPPEEAREKYNLGDDVRDWKVSLAQKDLKDSGLRSEKIVPILYRPFDTRFTYYTGRSRGFQCMPRPEVMRHMLAGENLGLVTVRQVAEGVFDHAFVSCSIVESRITLSNKGIGFLFPLYLYPTEGEMQLGEGHRRPNLNPDFIADVEKRLGMRFTTSPSNPLSVDGEGAGGEVTTGVGGEVKGEAHWHTPPELWTRLKPLARQMRREPTEAEELLWQHLRNHQLLGFKFRRQHSIERFIADFYCAKARLVVEVEGPVHQYQQEEDRIRQAFLESRGLRVLRFPNEDVLRNLERVAQQISAALTSSSGSLSASGEGIGALSNSNPLSVDGEGAGGEVITPEDIFHYAYAVFHSPTYRSRYAEFLKIDFPRLPLTSDKELFQALAEKGAELVALHLMESPTLNNLITRYPVTGPNVVDKVSYDGNAQRVFVNKEQYFEGVPPEVWNFHIGGYQVCQKWLKDRKGRTLSYDDLRHYQRVVVALKETIRLMQEIDGIIPGWPLN